MPQIHVTLLQTGEFRKICLAMQAISGTSWTRTHCWWVLLRPPHALQSEPGTELRGVLTFQTRDARVEPWRRRHWASGFWLGLLLFWSVRRAYGCPGPMRSLLWPIDWRAPPRISYSALHLETKTLCTSDSTEEEKTRARCQEAGPGDFAEFRGGFHRELSIPVRGARLRESPTPNRFQCPKNESFHDRKHTHKTIGSTICYISVH